MSNGRFDPNNITPPSFETIRTVGLVLLAVIILWKSVYTIKSEEVGVVLRLGAYSKELNPGLNFIMPFFDEVYKVPVLRQLKEEFGFRTLEAGVNTVYDSKEKYLNESLMLSGDLNSAQVEWIVQYGIKDAKQYLFMVNNVNETFRDINESVMREMIGDRSVNEVITIGRQEIADAAKLRVQQLCDDYSTGIRVEQIILQDVAPPDAVKPSFNEVNEAEQEKDKLINQALAEYNQVIPKAKGEAKRTIEEAKGYATERVNNALGEVSRFENVYREYSKAPGVTRQRIYLETMEDVLKRVGQKFITDDKATGILPMFDFKKGAKND
jgi:membrane protease subunit HflK